MKWMMYLCLLCAGLQAAELESNLDKLQGKRLGYYIGSFDPIHNGHQHFAQEALKQGYVDYVLIYPNPGGDGIKNRSSREQRQTLIDLAFCNHSNVLTTSKTPKELQELLEGVEIVGMVGSDFVTERIMGSDPALAEKYKKVFMRGLPIPEEHHTDTKGAIIALEASSFLVSLRGHVDLSYLNGKIYDRPINGVIQSEALSSTQIRNAISKGEAFEHLLPFPVQTTIKEYGWYGYSPKINEGLRDALLQMFEIDQALIHEGIQSDWDPAISKKVNEMHAEHYVKLRKIINEHGWPDASIVGLQGSQAMWLLVQHQDAHMEFQQECLPLLKAAVEKHEASFQNYAYLLDRVRKNTNQPQVYGTQWSVEDGKYILYLVEDPDGLDERRLQAGLPTMAAYRELMKEQLQLRDEDIAKLEDGNSR